MQVRAFERYIPLSMTMKCHNPIYRTKQTVDTFVDPEGLVNRVSGPPRKSRRYREPLSARQRNLILRDIISKLEKTLTICKISDYK